MSAHAGVWNFDGKPVDQAFLARLGSAIEPYGPNCCNSYVECSLGMVHHAFHTTAESCLERQPHVSARKNVITWDGRLDNREDLIRELRAELRGQQTDVAIVVAAYEKWGSDCLARIIGDWALSIWDANEQVLVLARDYIGVRQLYYHLKRDSLIWCTHLASLVLQSKTQFTINDEYIAGYLALWPEADLTPYCEIQAVPPGSFVVISGGEKTIHKYYNLGRRTRIRYKTDQEYEHHFLFAFRTAVKRRLRCTAPVLAELSGGLDSSSIVCMADDLIRSGEVNVPRLDTLSFYSAKEPDGDERPFFTKVEERLGRTGCHIDVQPYCKGDFFKVNGHEFTPNPGVLGSKSALNHDLADLVQRQGNKVLLSGIGGDEFLGGVPDPRPQLADLIVQVRLFTLGKQLMAWSVAKRAPLLHLLCQALSLLVPSTLRTRFLKEGKVDSWIENTFAHRTRIHFRQTGDFHGLRLTMPSYRDSVRTVMSLRKQLSFGQPSAALCWEKRYPFLDQSLVEFLISIPPDQLLRPGQRRRLMRRALVNLVPAEILDRRSKALRTRNNVIAIQNQLCELERLLKYSVAERLGFINASRLWQILGAAKDGTAPNLLRVVKGILLEVWLRNVTDLGLVKLPNEPLSVGDRNVLRSEL